MISARIITEQLTVNQANGPFHKCNHLTIKQLKRELAQLKRQNTPLTEVRYVSRLLRSKLGNSPGTSKSNYSVRNYDRILHKNFWGFVKNILQKSKSILPSFTQDHCTKFFLDFFRAVFPQRTFNTPSWLPSLPEPSTPFDQSSLSYEKITIIVRRMKSSSSPCPLDNISIICFKRCSYLRSPLTKIICAIWESGRVPMEWKKACTVLVHKKGNSDVPANFRPITLDSVPPKVFTSCLRDSVFSFLNQNEFIEAEI